MHRFSTGTSFNAYAHIRVSTLCTLAERLILELASDTETKSHLVYMQTTTLPGWLLT